MISIVTPTYNRAKLLMNMVESVLKQTFTDWELIIVDDGSKDNTSEIIQPYLIDERITYIKKANSGATDTRNVGAFIAKGEFLTFLDSDDEALPNWLEEVNNCIDEKTGVIFAGAIRNFGNDKTEVELPWKYNFLGENLRVKFTCGSFIVKREIFNAIEGYDTNLKSSQHTDLGLRLLNYMSDKDFKKCSINKSLIQINIHEGERIRTNWNHVSEGSIQFIEKHFNFLKSNNSFQYISNIYSVIAYSNYKLKKRQKSLNYLIKSIRYNPTNIKNYIKVFKYGFL